MSPVAFHARSPVYALKRAHVRAMLPTEKEQSAYSGTLRPSTQIIIAGVMQDAYVQVWITQNEKDGHYFR